MNDIFRFFSKTNGFNEHKNLAIDLLKQTINILNKFDIKHFLISGTLLGYVRHNDFIPWDDDIDIIIDSSIFDKIEAIRSYLLTNNMNLLTKGNYLIKFCFNNKITLLVDKIEEFTEQSEGKYYWPFVDLFIYKEDEEHLYFFEEKKWIKNEFFPEKKVLFNNIEVNIPNNPHYFLKLNFGDDYMYVLKSNEYSHKLQRNYIKRYGLRINDKNNNDDKIINNNDDNNDKINNDDNNDK